jgi:hypothetical protein
VHEDAEFLVRPDQQRREQVRHLLEVRVGGLAEVDGQDAGEGGIVPQGLEVYQLHHDVGVVAGVDGRLQLLPDSLHFAVDYFLLRFLGVCLPQLFDQLL